MVKALKASSPRPRTKQGCLLLHWSPGCQEVLNNTVKELEVSRPERKKGNCVHRLCDCLYRKPEMTKICWQVMVPREQNIRLTAKAATLRHNKSK